MTRPSPCAASTQLTASQHGSRAGLRRAPAAVLSLPLLVVAALLQLTSAPDTCDAESSAAGTCGSAAAALYRNGTRYWKPADGLFAAPVGLKPCDGGWRCVAQPASWALLQPPPSDDWPVTSQRKALGLPQESNSYCGLAVIYADDAESLDGAHFQATYRNKEPVIIRSRKGKGKRKPPQEAWLGKGKKARAQAAKFTRKAILKRAGQEQGLTGISHDLVKAAGNGYVPFSLADFMTKFMPEKATEDSFEGEPFYIFSREDKTKKTWAAETGGLVTPPPGNPDLFPTPLDAYNMIWLIGPPRSGTAFHSHTEAWTALAHGRKRWLFYPPNQSPPAGGSGPDTYPAFAITDWWDRIRPHLNGPASNRPIECVQEPGDLMYVPEGWHHAVINVEDVVGISFQNTSYSGGNFATELHDLLCREGSCDGDRWKKYTAGQKDNVLAGRRLAVEMAPDQPHTHHALGEALLFSNHASSGGSQEAADAYSKALELDPLLGASAVGLARSYFVLQQNPKVESTLREIIDKAPLNAHFRKMYEKLVLSQGHGRAQDGDKYTQRRLRDVMSYERVKFDLEKFIADGWKTV